jgi:two-component system response regulator AtoC
MEHTGFSPAQSEQTGLHRLSNMPLPEHPPLGTVSSGANVTTRSTIVDEADVSLPDSAGMHLLVMSPDSFNTYPLPKVGDVTIGRSGRSKIVIEDPKASREHARLYVDVEQGRYHIEDTDSANGTRVRDTVIPKCERIAVAPGEAIAIGTTVLMVQQNRTNLGHQRLWSHAYFETRLEAECARGDTAGGRFALVRFRVRQSLPWTRLAPILAQEIPAPNVFAAYGPSDYELLLLDRTPEQTSAVVEHLEAALTDADAPCYSGVANYPRDGRTVDELLSHANSQLRHGAAGGEAGKAPPSRPKNAAAESTVAFGPAMSRVQAMALRVAGANINVLILGETGVGKEVLATMLHQRSPRATKPLVALNCGSLPESIIESELFGNERGAFTGATGKIGLIESADGGTVFLDEIGELPLQVQAKLLRLIETRAITRVGGVKPKQVDVRFIAATNRDLEREVLKGTFRSDLFFRLNGISLSIPPLRERKAEIAPLALGFLRTFCAEANRPMPRLGEEVIDLLRGHSWPGNIRELKNVIERALILCDGDEIIPEYLPVEKMVAEPLTPAGPPRAAPPSTLSPEELAERQRMIDALEANVGNQTRAAADLGMPRRTFVAKLDRYGIPRPQKRPLRAPGATTTPNTSDD